MEYEDEQVIEQTLVIKDDSKPNKPAVWGRAVKFVRRCFRVAAMTAGAVVDVEDVAYIVGILMLSVGAEKVYGHGYGLLVAGAVVLVPVMKSIMFNRKGPQQ